MFIKKHHLNQLHQLNQIRNSHFILMSTWDGISIKSNAGFMNPALKELNKLIINYNYKINEFFWELVEKILFSFKLFFISNF